MKVIEVVAAAILDSERRVLIARRCEKKSLAGKWEFPGGKVEPGEAQEVALERELKEEFQIRISTNEFICSNIHHYDQISIELFLYRCTYLDGDYNLIDHDKIEWIDINKIHEYELAPADVPLIPQLIAKIKAL